MGFAPTKSATAAQQAAGCSQAASGSWLPSQNNFRLRGENDNLGDPGRNWEKLGEAARTSSPFALCACGMSGGRQTTRAVTSVRNTWPHHDRRDRQMVVSVVAHHYLANLFVGEPATKWFTIVPLQNLRTPHLQSAMSHTCAVSQRSTEPVGFLQSPTSPKYT